MLEKLFGFFRRLKLAPISSMSNEETFRMAMFTGRGLEAYAPMRFGVRIEGQNYEVDVDRNMKTEVRKAGSY